MKNHKIILFLSIILNSLFLIPSSAKAEESLFYIHQDHLGSTSMVTDEQGNVVSKQVYYPYGENRSQFSIFNSQFSVTEHQYTSQVSDQEQTNLYYYNVRYYSPGIGIFASADKVEGPNRYVYVNGNPIKLVDPMGQQAGTAEFRKADVEVSVGNSSTYSKLYPLNAVYYPQGFSGCSTGPGWAVPGNCGPPVHPPVDPAPTIVLSAYVGMLPFFHPVYGEWLFYDLILNGGAGLASSELASGTDEAIETGIYGELLGEGKFTRVYGNGKIVTKIPKQGVKGANRHVAQQAQILEKYGGRYGIPEYKGYEATTGILQREQLNGLSLDEFIKSGGEFTLADVNRTAQQLLDFQRDTGLSIGDLHKPSNIFIGNNGLIYFSDPVIWKAPSGGIINPDLNNLLDNLMMAVN